MELDLLYLRETHQSMAILLLKTCFSILLVALGRVLTMGPNLPEGYEDEGGFHYGTARFGQIE